MFFSKILKTVRSKIHAASYYMRKTPRQQSSISKYIVFEKQ